MSFKDSDKPVEHYERPTIVSKFASVSLSGYLSPPTRVSPFAGLQYLLLVLFVKLNFLLNSRQQIIRDLNPDLRDQKGLC